MPAPVPTIEPADASLVAAAQASLAATAQRTVIFEHGGERYVAKRLADRPRRLSQALLLRWLVKRVTGQSLPMRTLLLSDAASSVGYEARRLESLALAGVSVPRVVHHGANYLLLEHCGSTVAELLEAWSADTWRIELQRLANELGELHRAGQWHGAAQLKNLTSRNGRTYRIDFEENFGERVPLSAAQALDVVLFLNSVSLAGPIGEPEARQLLPRLLAAYFAANPDSNVREALVRALPWLATLARLASPFQRRAQGGRQRKGAARLAILADTLRAVLGGR
jgi:tRNA A-37 threonylcarbamoyl transferase component Bud32